MRRIPKIGDGVAFVDVDGKTHEARITAIHPAERSKGKWRGEDDWDADADVTISPERVDLVYAPDVGTLDPATAREKFSVRHKDDQTADERGRLGNYWQ